MVQPCGDGLLCMLRLDAADNQRAFGHSPGQSGHARVLFCCLVSSKQHTHAGHGEVRWAVRTARYGPACVPWGPFKASMGPPSPPLPNPLLASEVCQGQ